MCVVIGCPLILTDMEVVEKIESLSKAEREFLCCLLFYTINWFREVSAHPVLYELVQGFYMDLLSNLLQLIFSHFFLFFIFVLFSPYYVARVTT